MADVFISYKREQRVEVERLADRLRALGLSVWFDASLDAGTAFDEEIDREVRAAKSVLVCWSPEAIASKWVRAEASIGLERDVLVACTLRRTQLMAPFNMVQAPLLTRWNGRRDDPSWLQVLARIAEVTGRSDLVQTSLDQEAASVPTVAQMLARFSLSTVFVAMVGLVAFIWMRRRVWALLALATYVGLAIYWRMWIPQDDLIDHIVLSYSYAASQVLTGAEAQQMFMNSKLKESIRYFAESLAVANVILAVVFLTSSIATWVTSSGRRAARLAKAMSSVASPAVVQPGQA